MFWYCNFCPNREDKWDNFFYIFFWWSISWVEVLVYKFEYFLYDTKKRKDPNWLSDNYPIQFRTALLGYINSAQRSKCKKCLNECIFIIIQVIYSKDGVIQKKMFKKWELPESQGYLHCIQELKKWSPVVQKRLLLCQFGSDFF